jgi:hypothetical protein
MPADADWRLDSGPKILRVEQPSLLETLLDLPGTLLRLPASVLAALDAVPDVADRLDRLTTMVERMGVPMNRAGSGVDLATSGIANAVTGLQQAFGSLDTSLPFISDSASVLKGIGERLGAVRGELTIDVPDTTNSPPNGSPERRSFVEWPGAEQSVINLETVVTELAGLVETIVGAIPGVRRDPDRPDGHPDWDDWDEPDDRDDTNSD